MNMKKIRAVLKRLVNAFVWIKVNSLDEFIERLELEGVENLRIWINLSTSNSHDVFSEEEPFAREWACKVEVTSLLTDGRSLVLVREERIRTKKSSEKEERMQANKFTLAAPIYDIVMSLTLSLPGAKVVVRDFYGDYVDGIQVRQLYPEPVGQSD